jgi:kynurenine formamidase
MSTVPSEAEVLAYAQTLSNWGRWGPDDELGTLNLITDDTRRAALALATRGRSISLGWNIDPLPYGPDVKIPPMRYMVRAGQGLLEGDEPERQIALQEWVGFIFHGRRVTHLDAHSHLQVNGRMYNDRPGYLVSTEHGAAKSSITVAREGIVARGVLVDVPRHRGLPMLERGEVVHRDEVEAILAGAAIEPRAGDALLLRTGYGRARIEDGPKWDGKQAGWGASCLPFFREHDVAVIGADTTNEAHPSGYKNFRGPIHGIGIAAMGLWLVDNCNLEPIADACAELGTIEFALVLAPIPFAGATGSAINPLALL